MSQPISTTALLRGPEHPTENAETYPLLAVGFRPFFFLAAVAAVLLVPAFLWLLEHPTKTLLPIVDWHAHEMLFGFAGAVVAGFLLTAGGNWTSRRTITGGPLGILAALWVLGRVALLAPGLDPWLASAIDLSFYPATAVVLAVPIFATKNRRNYVFLALLAGLSLANLAFHLHAHGYLASTSWAKDVALRLYALMITIMGGRVIPMFTRNATGRTDIRNVPLLDRASELSLLVAMLFDLLPVPGELRFPFWLITGLLGLARMSTWGSFHARASLLWVLHVGYGAMAFSFILTGFGRLGVLPPSTGIHLFTVGGLGLLCFGMMTRVSLGHSGRMLESPASMTFAFYALIVATLFRTFFILIDPSHTKLWLVLGACGFAYCGISLLYFGIPIWFTKRVDRVGNFHGTPPLPQGR